MIRSRLLLEASSTFIVCFSLIGLPTLGEAEELPLTGSWDGKHNQLNVVDCTNTGSLPIKALITVHDKKERLLASKPFTAKPKDTVRLNLNELVKSKRRSSLDGKTGSYIIEASSDIESKELPLYCGRLIYLKTASRKRKFVEYSAAEEVKAVITDDSADSTSRTIYNSDNTVCDQDISTGISGNWKNRWGNVYASSNLEPSFHPCGANAKSARLVSQSINACGVYWKTGKIGTTLRNADVSFMTPSASTFNHLLVAPAHDPVSIGRIGVAVFRDKVFVQYNKMNDAGCAQSANLSSTTNLFPVSSGGGVRLTQAIQSNRWYRAYAQIRRLSSGLEITGIVHNDSLQQIGFVRQSFPMSCYPSWYNGANNTWLTGFLGSSANATLYLDDFVGRPARLQ